MCSEWPRTTFDQLCDIKRGASPRPIHDWLAPTGIPWVKISDATASSSPFISKTAEFIRPEGAKKSVEVFPGDFILSNSATPGIPKFMQIHACVHDGWMLLRNFRGLDQWYCYYLLQTERENLIRQGNGSVFTNLKTEILKKHEVAVPPLAYQKQVAQFLRSLDDRITLLRETNATLDAIAQALFKSWFVDFDPVRVKMEGRAPEGMDEATAALFPDSFEETNLGPTPRGWTHSTLADICSYLNRGISPKYVENEGVLVLNQKCVRDFSVDYTKGRRHDSAQRKISGRELAMGDILVNSTGVGTLGRVAQVLELPEPTIVDSHVTVVRASSSVTWPYLGQWMAKKQPEIEAMGEGSTGQTELSRAKLGSMAILVPSKDVLVAFGSVVEPLKARVALNENSARNLAGLRDALLPRLISGQLRLSEVEAPSETIAPAASAHGQLSHATWST